MSLHFHCKEVPFQKIRVYLSVHNSIFLSYFAVKLVDMKSYVVEIEGTPPKDYLIFHVPVE